jgi:hypothetical protein
MGRWAQRRTAGGGPLTSPPTAQRQMTLAEGGGPGVLEITYSGVVTAANFPANGWTLTPTNVRSSVVVQGAGDSLFVTFAPLLGTETFVTFDKSAPNVISPQKIVIS